MKFAAEPVRSAKCDCGWLYLYELQIVGGLNLGDAVWRKRRQRQRLEFPGAARAVLGHEDISTSVVLGESS